MLCKGKLTNHVNNIDEVEDIAGESNDHNQEQFAGLEKLHAHLCLCMYCANKGSLMYTKKRVRKLFLS